MATTALGDDREAPISPVVLIKGAGEMASAVAWRLHRANIKRICMTDLNEPMCVRRTVSFCTALEDGIASVEGVEARAADSVAEIEAIWRSGGIAVIGQSHWGAIADITVNVVVDAILAKRNTGTRIVDAPLVIALGPGFMAGQDCHVVVETNRGHNLGRILVEGSAEPNTGIPGDIAGHTAARVLRASAAGVFESDRRIGDRVVEGEIIGRVSGTPVMAAVSGILRGLIRSGTNVSLGLKLGDVDPRARIEYCHTISDKARAIGGAVLEGVLRYCNRPRDQVVLPNK